jgi:hypothetical protein
MVRQGFNSGLKPKLTDEGTSGTYEMRSAQKEKVGVFKPIDEEPFAPIQVPSVVKPLDQEFSQVNRASVKSPPIFSTITISQVCLQQPLLRWYISP